MTRCWTVTNSNWVSPLTATRPRKATGARPRGAIISTGAIPTVPIIFRSASAIPTLAISHRRANAVSARVAISSSTERQDRFGGPMTGRRGASRYRMRKCARSTRWCRTAPSSTFSPNLSACRRGDGPATIARQHGPPDLAVFFLKKGESKIAGAIVGDDIAGIGAGHPRGHGFNLGLVGFRDVFTQNGALVARALCPVDRRRSVGPEMPWPVLQGHVAGMDGGGGVQFGVQRDRCSACGPAHGIHAVERPKPDTVRVGGINPVQKRQRLSVGPKLGRGGCTSRKGQRAAPRQK